MAGLTETENTMMRPQKDNKPLVMVALNGARRGKDSHAQIPLTTQEIVEETIACSKAGADALHLHIRDKKRQHSLDPGRYRETLLEIETALPGFPVQVTTEAAGRFDVETQLDCLRELNPAEASISVREMTRDLDLAPRVYGLCSDAGIHVQHILYSMDDWQQLQDWWNAGIVCHDQVDVIVVLGQYAPARHATIEDLAAAAPIFDAAPGCCMVCAFGHNEHHVLLAAATRGCDLRIGFENNIHAVDGTLAPSNAAQVASLRSALPSIALEGIY
ncbi:MAG: 3-keto-5-aminohexanoate cleavage protein [Marinovum sp.]|nr:3-keto-5-aminohexanoate cleavage protein [Marinovum sp.]